jgi:hypothetical protein
MNANTVANAMDHARCGQKFAGTHIAAGVEQETIAETDYDSSRNDRWGGYYRRNRPDALVHRYNNYSRSHVALDCTPKTVQQLEADNAVRRQYERTQAEAAAEARLREAEAEAAHQRRMREVQQQYEDFLQ